MPLLEWWRKLLLLLGRSRALRELEEEMRFHQEMRAESLRSRGAESGEARYAARRRFGNQLALQERARDMWGLGYVEHLTRDVRHAVRRMTQRPGFSAAIIIVVALGVGATTAMFSAVDAAMLRPLPFHAPGQLVSLRSVRVPFDPGGRPGATPRTDDGPHWVDVSDIATMRETFSGVAAYGSGGLNLSDPDRPVRVRVGVVTASLFPVLGITPIRGRGFASGESVPGGPAVTVLSYGMWRRQFGGADVLRRSIVLSGKSYEVVGVMPRGFGFPDESDLWIPMTVPSSRATFEAFRGYIPSYTVARMAAGVDVARAEVRLRARWEQQAGTKAPGARRTNVDDMLDDIRARGAVAPLQRNLVGDRRSALLILLGATGFLLLIACANATNLLLSQAATRRREIAVREVLGATRGRIVQQLLAESLVLAAAGTALGILLAPLALGAMRALLPAALSGLAPARIDLRVLTFAALLALVTGVTFGLWPALGSTRRDASAAIRSGGGHGATAAGAGRGRRALVTVELALSLMLLIGAGLMLKSFTRLMQTNQGMNPDRVGTLELSFARSSAGSAARLAAIDAVLARLEGTPGIDAAGVVNDLPLNGSGGMSISVATDVPKSAKGRTPFARYLQVSAGYFQALGIPLLRGRAFTARDDSLAPRVAIVSAAMATRLWPGADPVGRALRVASDTVGFRVVGVVSDVREQALDQEPLLQMYFPVYEVTPLNIAVVARGSLAPAALLGAMRDAVRAADPSQAVYNVRMMADVVGRSVAPRRANAMLISLFAGLALILASLGVYAVVSCEVSQRTRELGIRSALGASAADLFGLMSRGISR